MSKKLAHYHRPRKKSCDTFNHQQNYSKTEIKIKYNYKVVVCFQVVELMHPKLYVCKIQYFWKNLGKND